MATILNPNLAGQTRAQFQQGQAQLAQSGMQQAANAVQTGQQIDQRNRQMLWDQMSALAKENPLGFAGLAMNKDSRAAFLPVMQKVFGMDTATANTALTGMANRILSGQELGTLDQFAIMTGQVTPQTPPEAQVQYDPLSIGYVGKPAATEIRREDGSQRRPTQPTPEQVVQPQPPIKEALTSPGPTPGTEQVALIGTPAEYAKWAQSAGQEYQTLLNATATVKAQPDYQQRLNKALSSYMFALYGQEAWGNAPKSGILSNLQQQSEMPGTVRGNDNPWKYLSATGPDAIVEGDYTALGNMSNTARNAKATSTMPSYATWVDNNIQRLNEVISTYPEGSRERIMAEANMRAFQAAKEAPNYYFNYKVQAPSASGSDAGTTSTPATQNWTTDQNGTQVQQYGPQALAPMQGMQFARVGSPVATDATWIGQGEAATPPPPPMAAPMRTGVVAQGRFQPGMTPDAGPNVPMTPEQRQAFLLNQRIMADAQAQVAAQQQAIAQSQTALPNQRPAPAPAQPLSPNDAAIAAQNQQIQAAAQNIQQGGTGQVPITQTPTVITQPSGVSVVDTGNGTQQLATTPVDGTPAAQAPTAVKVPFGNGELTFANAEAQAKFNAMSPAEQAYNLSMNPQTAGLLTPAQQAQARAFKENLVASLPKATTRYFANYQGKLSADTLQTVAYGLNLTQPTGGKIEDNPILAPLFYNATDAQKRKTEAEIENLVANAFQSRAQGAYALKQAEFAALEFTMRANAQQIDAAAQQVEALGKILPSVRSQLDPYMKGLEKIYVDFGKDPKKLADAISQYQKTAMEDPQTRSALESTNAIIASMSQGFLGFRQSEQKAYKGTNLFTGIRKEDGTYYFPILDLFNVGGSMGAGAENFSEEDWAASFQQFLNELNGGGSI